MFVKVHLTSYAVQVVRELDLIAEGKIKLLTPDQSSNIASGVSKAARF